jgi:glycosyltransferase involved in cell wall biosynthesis
MILDHRLGLREPQDNRVSVIIPTKNSARTITSCIEAIKKQTHTNLEIIVIDSDSVDGTDQLARDLGAKVIRLAGERTRAKNRGISVADGDFVVFIDSDMSLEPTVIEDCIRACSTDKKIAGVIIPEKTIGPGFWVRVRDFERSFYDGTAIESARFFRRNVAMQVNGFDEDVVFFEESTLPHKIQNLGLDTHVRIQSFIRHDETGFNIRRWLAKKSYYTNTSNSYASRYADLAEKQMSVSYRLKAFTADGKWKRLMRHPMLAIGLFILKGLEYLYSRKG